MISMDETFYCLYVCCLTMDSVMPCIRSWLVEPPEAVAELGIGGVPPASGVERRKPTQRELQMTSSASSARPVWKATLVLSNLLANCFTRLTTIARRSLHINRYTTAATAIINMRTAGPLAPGP